MKKVSDTYKELGIDFTFPIVIKNANGDVAYFEDSGGWWTKYEYDSKGNEIYCENSDRQWYESKYDSKGNQTYSEHSDGFWSKHKYDSKGNVIYYENSNDYWYKCEYDSKGNVTYCENSIGDKKGTPRGQSCAGKVIEVDGKKYKLEEL